MSEVHRVNGRHISQSNHVFGLKHIIGIEEITAQRTKTMARKRMRRRRADTSTPNQGSVVSFDPLSGGGNSAMVDGNGMHVRILQTTEEGVLYTHAISVSGSSLLFCCVVECVGGHSLEQTVSLTP